MCLVTNAITNVLFVQQIIPDFSLRRQFGSSRNYRDRFEWF